MDTENLIDQIAERLDPDGEQPGIHDQIADKLLPGELERTAEGYCVSVVAYGSPGGTEYCDQMAVDGSILCAFHRTETIEDHGPDSFGVGYLDA